MTIIRKRNGKTYNLDDFGIRTRFFDVKSPNFKNNLEEVPGRTGLVDYGSDFGTRTIEVGFRIIAEDQTDFPLFRNEIFNLLASDEAFYISESRRKSVQWLVRVESPYSIDKRNLHGYFTVKFISITGFAESTYTTLELHDSGYTAGGGTVPSGLTSSDYQTLFGSVGNSQLLASDIQKLDRDLNVLKRDVSRYEGEYGLVDGIDDEKVKYRFTENEFTVYNAGNVTVEPESMMLNIFTSYMHSEGDFTIRNKTTGEEIVLQRESNGSHFRIYGMTVSLGSITNIFRDTNRRFISLVPGDNHFEILNGTFEEIRFDFKYVYK